MQPVDEPAAVEPVAVDSGKANLSYLAKLTGGRPGYFRTAFTMQQLDDGRVVAVRLDRVTAEAAYPCEDRGTMRNHLPIEYRPAGLARMVRAITRLTMDSLTGWRPNSRK